MRLFILNNCQNMQGVGHFLAQYKQLVLRTETFFNAERIKVI